MRWWLAKVAVLCAACDSSSTSLQVVAITTDSGAVYCRYNGGTLDTRTPADACPADPGSFRAARIAPKGAPLRVVFNKPLDGTRLGTPIRMTCAKAGGGQVDIASTFEYRADDPLGPTLLVVPDLAGAHVPTSTPCTIAVDRSVVDEGGSPIPPGSAFEAKIEDLRLVSVAPIGTTGSVVAPRGEIAFTFNADLDPTTLDASDFELVNGTRPVPFELAQPTAAPDSVHVYGTDPYSPGGYSASIRSTAQIKELNGGTFVFDAAGPHVFPFTVTDTVITSIEITAADPSVPLGMPVQMTAMGTFSDGSTTDVTTLTLWSVDNPAAATVSNMLATRGVVSGKTQGSVTVTGIAGGEMDTFVVTFEPPVMTGIAIDQADGWSISAGTTLLLTATATFSDASTCGILTTCDATLVPIWTANPATGRVDISSSGVVMVSSGGTTGPVTVGVAVGSFSDTSVGAVVP